MPRAKRNKGEPRFAFRVVLRNGQILPAASESEVRGRAARSTTNPGPAEPLPRNMSRTLTTIVTLSGHVDPLTPCSSGVKVRHLPARCRSSKVRLDQTRRHLDWREPPRSPECSPRRWLFDASRRSRQACPAARSTPAALMAAEPRGAAAALPDRRCRGDPAVGGTSRSALKKAGRSPGFSGRETNVLMSVPVVGADGFEPPTYAL